MSDKSKLKKIVYFTLEFIAIGIDIVHPISYSFFIANTIIGYDLLYQEKDWKDIPKLQYILGLIIIPIFLGWMLKTS